MSKSKELEPDAVSAAKALSHYVRHAIVSYLARNAPASPSDISSALGDTGPSLGTISYHMRMLRDWNFVDISHTEPRRGAVEHYYVLTADGQRAMVSLVGTTRMILKDAGR